MLGACTDLNETLYDKVSMDDYGQTSNEVQTIVAGAYATLRGYGADTDEGNGANCYPTCEYVFFLSACASDEACIPTRGTDWYDGGRYQQVQYHTWDAQNQMILSAWRYPFIGISKINAIIYQVDQSELTEAAKDKVKAELRGLRAYYYYQLLDQFGAVPITTDFTASGLPQKSSRQEVFNFVEKELTDIMELLPRRAICPIHPECGKHFARPPLSECGSIHRHSALAGLPECLREGKRLCVDCQLFRQLQNSK